MDDIRLFLELQSGAFVPFLASGLFLGGRGTSLVNRGGLWLVEEIGGGWLAAVAAVLVFLLLKLCYLCILCSDDVSVNSLTLS